MSFYATRILPHLVEMAMRQEILVPYRRRTLAEAAGPVLEIGSGSGPNMPHYSAAADWVCAIDPSPELGLGAGVIALPEQARFARRRAGCPLLPAFV